MMRLSEKLRKIIKVKTKEIDLFVELKMIKKAKSKEKSKREARETNL